MKYIIVVLFSLVVFAEGKVGNGGDISTRTIIFAAKNLKKYLNYCIGNNYCSLDKKQLSAVQNIEKKVLSLYEVESLLVFKNNQDNFFTSHGVEKLAMTYDYPGAKIYINLNKLKYFTNSEAVSLLVHELGHQVGEEDHHFLDILGVSVSTQVRSLVKSTGEIIDESIKGVLYYEKELDGKAHLITDGGIINISDFVEEKISCDKPSLNLVSEKSQLEILNIYQASFSYKRNGIKYIPITIWLRSHCDYGLGGKAKFVQTILVNLAFSANKSQFIKNKTTTKTGRIPVFK